MSNIILQDKLYTFLNTSGEPGKEAQDSFDQSMPDSTLLPLIEEIHEYLQTTSHVTGLCLDLSLLFVSTLGFGLVLMDCDQQEKVLDSLLQLARNSSLAQVISKNVLIASHLVDISSYANMSDELDNNEISIKTVQLFMHLYDYHPFLIKVASQDFLLSFKDLVLSNLVTSNLLPIKSQELYMKALLAITTACDDLSFISDPITMQRLVKLISHENLVISSSAVGILKFGAAEPHIKSQVFCKENTRDIINLVLKMIKSQLDTKSFRNNMGKLVQSLEVEGLIDSELAQEMATNTLKMLKESAGSNTYQTFLVEVIVLLGQLKCIDRNHELFSTAHIPSEAVENLALAAQQMLFQKDHASTELISFFDALLTHQSPLDPLLARVWTDILAFALDHFDNQGSSSIFKKTWELIKSKAFSLEQQLYERIYAKMKDVFKDNSTGVKACRPQFAYSIFCVLLLFLSYSNQEDLMSIESDLSRLFPTLAKTCFSSGIEAQVSIVNLITNTPVYPWNKWIANSNTCDQPETSKEETFNKSMIQLTSDFKSILRAREKRYQRSLSSLEERLSADSRKDKVDDSSNQTPPQNMQKIISSIQATRNHAQMAELKCRDMEETIGMLESNNSNLESDLKDANVLNQTLSIRISALEENLSQCNEQIQSMECDITEKLETIALLQSELDEQTEYQAMVAKLAETVNRRKPNSNVGGMVSAPVKSRLGTTRRTAPGANFSIVPERTEGQAKSPKVPQRTDQESGDPLSQLFF